MKTRPISSQCEALFHRKDSICFGISPFNSYFSEDRIARLAQWGRQTFRSMHFFLPDVPSAYTLEALGYSKERSVNKARQQSNYTRNKLIRALERSGLSFADARARIIDWSVLSENKHFFSLHQNALELFENDSLFRSECLRASRWVLEKRLSDEKVTDDILLHAVKYFLAELPLFADAAGIIGQESTLFAYHQCIPFLEKLYQGRLPLLPAKNQGFIVLESQERAQGMELASHAFKHESLQATV